MLVWICETTKQAYLSRTHVTNAPQFVQFNFNQIINYDILLKIINYEKSLAIN